MAISGAGSGFNVFCGARIQAETTLPTAILNRSSSFLKDRSCSSQIQIHAAIIAGLFEQSTLKRVCAEETSKSTLNDSDRSDLLTRSWR